MHKDKCITVTEKDFVENYIIALSFTPYLIQGNKIAHSRKRKRGLLELKRLIKANDLSRAIHFAIQNELENLCNTLILLKRRSKSIHYKIIINKYLSECRVAAETAAVYRFIE